MSAPPEPALIDAIVAAPKLSEARKAKARFIDLLTIAREEAPDLLAALDAKPVLRDLLLGLADHSPYLWRLAALEADRLWSLLQQPAQARCDAIVAEAAALWREAADEAALMRGLRRAKQELALVVALADIGGHWGVEPVTEALAALADAAVASAVRFVLLRAAEAGRFRPVSAADPALDSGIVVLALGKHGARELNYSSDIDIVVFYDPDKAPLAETVEPTPFFVRLVKDVVKIIQERTSDGYVFRTDLRLRPDPASTPPAVPLPSAYSYYETVGQNWERAALIKARPIAGDIPLGEEFLASLAPFIWRKYFDFAAIADIHAMKRQIHAVRGHETITVAGHNIKLGRGGIREVEFFVQTQQLVFGGRRAQLRGRRTLDMLVALRDDGWITAEAERELAAAYRFLRTVEHRLQMLADEQTQSLPGEGEKLARFARFCGYPGLPAFGKALTGQARLVEKHYARLFEEGGELTAEDGNLVFTGTVDDPDTLQTLGRMGFARPAEVAETVRGWHFGRRQAVTSPRAREVLTELVPMLLAAFGRSADPDGALVAFDRALGKMPAAVELFSILKSHKPVLALFADLLGSAPRMAETVSRRPHLLDAIIDPAFARAAADVPSVLARLQESIGQTESLEDVLDRLRESGQHEIFLVGARAISGVISLDRLGEAYAAVAEAIIRFTLDEVSRRFAVDHGQVPGGRIAVLGMGRLGSGEMTATSDLDLVVLYDFNEDGPESDGPRPLNPVVYYARLTQRLISALTVPTRRGTLYAVDMRLRPSGNKGPAATQFKGFLSYHQSEAEIWEHMALARARPVAGEPLFVEEVGAIVRAVLNLRRDPAVVRKEALAMRRLIAQEKGEEDRWDLKLAAGGLLDVEFVAQALVLIHGREHPSLVHPSTATVIDRAAASGLLPPAQAEALQEGHRLQHALFQWLRLTVPGRFVPAEAPAGLKRRLAALVGLPDFSVLAGHLADTQAAVRSAMLAVLENPR